MIKIEETNLTKFPTVRSGSGQNMYIYTRTYIIFVYLSILVMNYRINSLLFKIHNVEDNSSFQLSVLAARKRYIKETMESKEK